MFQINKTKKEKNMNKEQKEIMKKVNKAFSELYVLSNITWTPYRDVLFKMNKKDEKQHRVGDWSEYHKGAASINDCAKLFTVKQIAESLFNKDKYKVDDLLKIKQSNIYAQSIVSNYEDKILKAWKDQDLNYLANLDYISLVNYDLYLEQLEHHKKYLRTANDLKGSKKII
jgi:hypothetical protein